MQNLWMAGLALKAVEKGEETSIFRLVFRETSHSNFGRL